MTPPPDDKDDELNDADKERDEESSGEKGKSGGKAGGGVVAGRSIEETAEEAEARRKKKGDSGEGDSDSFGRGKAGAGAGGGIRLSAQKMKEVMADWRHLDMAEMMEAVAEFFSAVPMRASANLNVAWEKATSNVKSFAIVNWIIEAGDKTVRELARTRERTRGADSNGLKRKPNLFGAKPAVNPTGPTGAR